MVFWALMVDRFSLEQRKRLFGVVAVGGTLGAMFGPWLAWTYVERIGTANLILVAVGFLILAVVAAWAGGPPPAGEPAGSRPRRPEALPVVDEEGHRRDVLGRVYGRGSARPTCWGSAPSS